MSSEKDAEKIAKGLSELKGSISRTRGGGYPFLDVQEERLGLLELIDEAVALARVQRVRSPQAAKIRIESARCLGYLCSIKSSVLRDFSLSDMEARLRALEEGTVKNEGGEKEKDDDE